MADKQPTEAEVAEVEAQDGWGAADVAEPEEVDHGDR